MEIVDKFKQITVWNASGKRAPHKPLLILYAIGCLLRNKISVHHNIDTSNIVIPQLDWGIHAFFDFRIKINCRVHHQKDFSGAGI